MCSTMLLPFHCGCFHPKRFSERVAMGTFKLLVARRGKFRAAFRTAHGKRGALQYEKIQDITVYRLLPLYYSMSIVSLNTFWMLRNCRAPIFHLSFRAILFYQTSMECQQLGALRMMLFFEFISVHWIHSQ